MLDVAGGLFSERGFHDVTMDEVALGAGITKPMVYSYFGSKEGLFLACVEKAEDGLLEEVERAAAPDVPVEQRLWRGLVAVYAFVEQHSREWELLYPAGPRSGGQFGGGASRASERMATLMSRLLADTAVGEGVDPEVARRQTEPMAHALVAAVQGLASWWVRNPGEPKELQAMRMMNLAWMGLANVVAGRLWVPPVGMVP